MDKLLEQITGKKAELDRLRQQAPGALVNLEHAHDLELTYTSNAIEGNTLSAAESTLVVEKGLTIGGKPLRDHLEVIDHHEAIGYVRDLRSECHRGEYPQRGREHARRRKRPDHWRQAAQGSSGSD